LHGDANDYAGKGLSGGRIVIVPPDGAEFAPSENIIVGNVILYGATEGEFYARGAAGERFCVRNSGATAIVEGVGDHACEYMTGGVCVVLGNTGRNFAAGMSGGIAYVYDEDGTFSEHCNTAGVIMEPTEGDDRGYLKELLRKHAAFTGSDVAVRLLDDWAGSLKKFVTVVPREYRQLIAKSRSGGRAAKDERDGKDYRIS
jgi:glutamate synthase domain-containing protein 3